MAAKNDLLRDDIEKVEAKVLPQAKVLQFVFYQMVTGDVIGIVEFADSQLDFVEAAVATAKREFRKGSSSLPEKPPQA